MKDHGITRAVYNNGKQEIIDAVDEMKGFAFRYKYAGFIDQDEQAYKDQLTENALQLRENLKLKLAKK